MHRRLVIVYALFALFFIYSVGAVIDARTEIRELTIKKTVLRDKSRELQDINRNLKLEVATLTDYHYVRKYALNAGMKEPSFVDGTWIRLDK